MSNLAKDFRKQLQTLSDLGSRQKFSARYTGGDGCFEELPAEAQTKTVTALELYNDILLSCEAQKLDFTNSVQLVKGALKKLRMVLPDDQMALIDSNDFIEIYTLDFIAAFKTPNFWGTGSYSLDEVFSYPYDELFERDEFYQAAINRVVQKIMTGEQSFIQNPIPTHTARERRGSAAAQISYKYIATVQDPDDGHMVGVIVVCDLKRVA
ncbi:MAG TPA: hypothetical protein VF412_16125 [Bdellovibrio sp.]|uniref:hypothetical protein n=1 Tax=Bdellovibrio sp. TaxID=28201 RepID=UPI002EE8B0C0